MKIIMNDKEKLEAIKKALYNIPIISPSENIFEKALGKIAEILEKKTLTDYEKLVVNILDEITYLYDNEKPTKANYEMTIQRIKKVIKYPDWPRGIGGYESLLKSIRRRIVLQEERTKSTKKDYENTIQQIKELVNEETLAGNYPGFS